VRLGLAVAVGAVEPFAAAGRADGDLRVEDVFAAGVLVLYKPQGPPVNRTTYHILKGLYGQ
jgi:hypothetical protein